MPWLNRILIATGIAVVLAWLPSQLAEHAGAEDLDRVVGERDELAAGNERLREEIEILEAEVAALHIDPEAPGAHDAVAREVERIAREDLNLVRAGEVVFEVRTKEVSK